MNEEYEVMEMEDLGEFEDMEDYEDLEDFEEFEDYEDYEDYEDFEEFEDLEDYWVPEADYSSQGSVATKPIRRRRGRGGQVGDPGIPGGNNHWFPSQGEARNAALRVANAMGLGYGIAHDPRPSRGQPHYHVVNDRGRRVSGHFFYGQKQPHKVLRRDLEDYEEMEDFEDWEGPPTRTRPRGPITLPPIVIRVRPSVILTQFGFNKDTLSPQHVNQIKQVARRVASSWTRRPGRSYRPIRTIRLVGHTDNRGPASYNKTLGMRRAQAVRSRLVAEINRLRPGLAARIRIIPQSVGEIRPMASNATAAGRARNRRVAVYLSSDP